MPRNPDGVLAGTVLTMIEAVQNLHRLGAPLERGRGRDRRAGPGAQPSRAGTLAPGLPADVVVVDDPLELVRVLVGGDTRVVLRPGLTAATSVPPLEHADRAQIGA